MRRSRTLAAGLVVVCAGAAGCGTSSQEIVKPRPPSGQGETRGPDVSVETVDQLRVVEVSISGGRFTPDSVSVGLDSTVRITNRGTQTANIRATQRLAEPIGDNELEPGETAELDFLDSGIERIELTGSDAVLEINVSPPL